MKKVILALSFLILVFAAAYVSYIGGVWRVNYPSLEAYPVQGLDVSHHQGEIDWSKIPKDRFKFVYIKATEGGDFTDKRFDANWRAAKKEGFKVGAYHFFTLCRPGVDQANHFIKTVPLEAMDLPPVIDLEFGGNCSKRPSKEELAKELRDYIEIVEKRYGVEPVLYITYEFHKIYLAGGEFMRYPIWLRDVWGRPKMEGWHMWQYADNARISGVIGPVDLNVMAHEKK